MSCNQVVNSTTSNFDDQNWLNQIHVGNKTSIMEQQSMKRSNIVEFYRNRSVLITGGSGFIGKVLIEKLLRSCNNLRHIFVLIRPKRGKQPNERLQELLKAPLFDLIRVKNLHQKVIVVEGDVTSPNLGLSEQNLLRIMNEVSVVFHSAATVKFDEPLKQSVGINITGTRNIVELCRKIPQLAALVHVSTAYANCDRDEIDEHIYPIDNNINPENLIEMANWLDQETLQELKNKLLASRPNTYTYTKALAEWLLVKIAKDLPVVICRPSIVTASWREPFGGWIDNINGPTGVILGAGKGLIRSMFAESSFVADLVPVDTVVNLIITLGWFAYVYKNHKILNDAAESLSESITESDSLFADGDSLDDYSNRMSPIVEINYEGNSISNGRDNDSKNDTNNNNNNNNNNNSNNNNNNNNSHVSAYDSNCSRARKLGRDNKRNCKIDQSSHEGNLTFSLQRKTRTSPVLSSDDGYGSAVQSPDTKTTVSLSSFSSSPSNPSQNSTSETTDSMLNDFSEDNNIINRTSNNSDDNNNNDNNSNDDEHNLRQPVEENHSLLSLVAQKRLDDQNHAAFEYKLKQFRHNTQLKLASKELPEDIADVPVFHCTSGRENPITWGRINILVVAILALFPSITTYRYPCGSFTNNKRLDAFYRFTLHYIPAYIIDFFTQLFGGKAQLVKIFKKFDQAANVLMAFTSRQWRFNSENRSMLIHEIMSEEDRLLFNCDINSLDWSDYLADYVLGVRKFVLKEPISNLAEARRNLNIVYYRNLSLQILFSAMLIYCLIPFKGSLQLGVF